MKFWAHMVLAIIVMSLMLSSCGDSSHSSENYTEESAAAMSWTEEEAEEGYYYGDEAARVANETCNPHGGVRELFFEEGLELVVCEDGHVGSPYE